MIRGFRQIAFLTALSRIFGLVRDIAYGHFFGAGGLFDAWIIAFRIPNLSRRLFGEGAASASFIPVYSEVLHKDRTRAAGLLNTVVTALFVILASLVLIGEAVIWFYYKFFARTNETELILSLSSVMLPYMLFVCLVAILAGILNVHRHFARPALAPIVLNFFIIGTILLTGWVLNIEIRQQLFYVAIAVLIAGLVQIAIQVQPLRHSGVSIRPAWDIRSEPFRRILLLMGPMIIGLTVTQINTLADDLIAWWFSGSDEKGPFFELLGRQIQYPMWRGSVSHLYYAQRLYQLPLGVLGISLATAIFPVMSADAARGDFAALKATISKGIRGTVFIAVPATIGIIIVSGPLISAAFEHGRFTTEDTKMVVQTLGFYAMGLCAYCAQQVLARAFYSMQDSKTPMRSALVAVVTNFLLNLTLIWFLGRAGLAAATAICAYLQVVILTIVLRRRLGHEVLAGLANTLVRTFIAAAIMSFSGLLILFLMKRLPDSRLFDVLRLAAVVPSAAVVYALCSRLLRIEMLSLFTGKRAG
ncbi:MAG: murein biosynthesis integral membrane protein MurJ [Sedimentisphaerales bacterium]|nr:murein biosynthesis integral membrane protein MurJ [Sedimentisphaerales bacterium]